MLRRSWVFALCIVAGCEPTGLRNDIRISITSGDVLPADPLVTRVTFVARNRGSIVAYLPRCGENVSTAVERFDGSGWVDASGDFCLTNNRMDPIRLDPGAEYTSIRAIRGPGRFRLRTSVTADLAQQMDSGVFSEAFAIH